MGLGERVSVQEAMAGHPKLHPRGPQCHGWGLRHPSHLRVRHVTVGTEQTAWILEGEHLPWEGVYLLEAWAPPSLAVFFPEARDLLHPLHLLHLLFPLPPLGLASLGALSRGGQST